MRFLRLAVGVLSVTLLFGTHQAASSPTSGCASATISIRTGTDTVAPGTTIGIAGGISNCSSQKARYVLVVSALSSCGQKANIASSRMALNAGENKIWSVSYPLPSDTCAGTWEATVEVRDVGGSPVHEQSGSMASSSTSIMIQ